MLPGDVYVRQMLIRHHRAALSPHPRVPTGPEVFPASPTRRRGRRLRVIGLRLRLAQSTS